MPSCTRCSFMQQSDKSARCPKHDKPKPGSASEAWRRAVDDWSKR